MTLNYLRAFLPTYFRPLLVAALLANFTPLLQAQSALDGFDPNANGDVRVIVVQPDGKILIGGNFTTIAPNGGTPVTRNRIARLNPDGSLDIAFNPDATGSQVDAIALQADGRILVGGFFTSIGGQTRSGLARLDATSGLADSFDPNVDGGIQSLVVQADGKILAGGHFGSIGGQLRNHIARLDPVTGSADSFNPNANGGSVFTISLQPDGRIFAGGSFTSIGGQTRNRIARLDPTTGLADPFDPNANSTVTSIALQADGRILAGGAFTGIGGQTRKCLARLDGATGLADSFDPNVANSGGPSLVLSVAVQTDGRIVVGGYFTSIGGQPRTSIARLDPSTGTADAFDPNANMGVLVFSIAQQTDGKILAGGSFATIGGQPRNKIARLETDGRLDRTLDLGVIGGVITTTVQPDGQILIGGYFSSVLGAPRNNIARLKTDGTLDSAFNPNANGDVFSITVQADGRILAGGRFDTIGGQSRKGIARLDATTGAADSFNPNLNGDVFAIAVQADGNILAGGSFTSVGKARRIFIARLDATTGSADSFDPNANDYVSSIMVQPDGRILVAGAFTVIGGQPRNRIARLDVATGSADSFDAKANNFVTSIAVQPDNSILVGGIFSSIGGQTRHRIARLDPDGVLDLAFNTDATQPLGGPVSSIAVQANGKIVIGGSFQSIGGQPRRGIARLDAITGSPDSYDPNKDLSIYINVTAIGVQTDGKILVGGGFDTIAGEPRSGFARLSNTTPALQDLSVTQTAITWTRGGSSAQFTRVTFEYSTDNLNYTPLGNGNATGSSWTLAGLNLPAGQNSYIRARGYYSSGGYNASENALESVRNAFFTVAPLQISAAVSRKMHGGLGPFDIDLLNANSGPECRSSGGAHTLVFTFNNHVVSGSATVTTGTGSISGSPAFSGNTMAVNLSGVADVQKITVILSSVTDTSAQILPDTEVSVNVLAGDTNGNQTVNATDIGQIKEQSGVPVTMANFRQDVTPNGTITASDIGLVKSRSGQFLPK